MKLEEFYNYEELDIVGINGKNRKTWRGLGYSNIYVNRDGDLDVFVNENWIYLLPLEYGILCQYVPTLDLYYSVLDIDTKDYPIEELQEEYPTCVTVTPHGYHFHYLSTGLVNIKQLTKDKNQCPIDIRGQRNNEREGNYVKL